MEPRTNVLREWDAIELLTFYERIDRTAAVVGDNTTGFIIDNNGRWSLHFSRVDGKRNQDVYMHVTRKEAELLFFFSGTWDEYAPYFRLDTICGHFRNAAKAKVDAMIPFIPRDGYVPFGKPEDNAVPDDSNDGEETNDCAPATIRLGQKINEEKPRKATRAKPSLMPFLKGNISHEDPPF